MATRKKSKKELLRQKAEKLLSKKSHIVSKIEDKDAKKLVHELQVHQIELEMQNEELRTAQAEIEESRTKYSDLYDFAPVGYFTFNRAGEIVEVNLTGASLLGVDRGKLLHRSLTTFVDPEFQTRFRDHRLNVLKSGGRERCELKLLKKDGKSFYASLESISVPHGQNHRIRSAVSDITDLKKAQEEAETEHAFRIAIENSILSGIAAVDLEGRQSYVNLGFCRMVGRSEEELLGRKPPFAYWPPEELDHLTKAFQIVTEGKAPRDGLELRFIRKNGERFDALVVPSPLKDSNGNVTGWIGTFGDITHLKEMERELKQLNTRLEERVRQRTAELEAANQQLKQEITERKRAEEKLSYLASFPEINPNPIVEVNFAGPLHYLNPAAKELFPDLTTSGIQHPLLAGLESFADSLKEKTKGSLWREVKVDNRWYEQAFFRVSGMDRIRIYSRDITKRKRAEEELRRSRDELEIRVQERTLELMDAVEELQDEMSERKRVEEVLKEERQRFNDLLEMLPAYLVLLTPDHQVPFANRFFRERFGESHGKRCFEYLFGRSEPCEVCETFTVLKTMGSHEWEWVGPEGRNYYVFDFPFTDTDGSPLILEMGIDITERKQAEEALKESESRLRSLSSQLLTIQENERKSIARELHDGIGQLLTAIKFKLEDTLREKGTGKNELRKTSLEALNQMVKHSIDEVRKIQMDLRPSTLDDLGILATISWFTREFGKIYSSLHIEKRIEIEEVEVPDSLKTTIFRVIQESLNNAAKHSKADTVHLSLQKTDGRIELRIEDNGIGFDLESILSLKSDMKGYGLSNMRERVELSGGSFTMESVKGKGTLMRASWPLKQK